MVTHLDLKIFDRDFRILKQLSVNEYRNISDSGNGSVCERVQALKGLGLVESKRGRYGGHRLTRSLSSIPFSYWFDAVRDRPCSPVIKLLQQFDHVSVGVLLTYPPYSGEGWSLPLDHAVGILSRLSPDTPTLPRLLDYPLLNTGYLAHIYTELSRCGLTRYIPRKGVVLTRPFDRIILVDVLPVISHSSRVFSAMVSHVSGLHLVSLLSEGGM